MMTMRLTLLLLAAAAAATLALAKPSDEPNFVIILADDMGWGDWSRTGSPARTPHLDAMSRADSAVWFQRAYSGNPICSPTRASLQTGRTPARSCIWSVEQHILCHAEAGGCERSEYSLANATRDAKADYLSGFYGKWHLGSLSMRGINSPDCYAKPSDSSCQLGYWERTDEATGSIGCCFGVDNKLDVSHPIHFGYDEFVATPECAASATTNCGCFFYPTAHNDTQCELGHYHQGAGAVPYNECMQYYVGNVSGPARVTRSASPPSASAFSSESYSIEPITYVSDVDDEKFLVDHFEQLVLRAVGAGRPFLAVICFHGVHIPYVATPATRATYPNMTTNEQDYWGTITQIDAQIGRIRALLEAQGIADRTWVSFTADNGPEVNPEGGQGTGNFANPGLTGGLRGRKRDVTEGGTRVIGLVEYPRAAVAVKGGRTEPHFPIITSDLLPSVLDVLGLPPHSDPNATTPRALDGISLLPYLRGETQVRPTKAGIGIHGIFRFGTTNHKVNSSGTFYLDICPRLSAAVELGDVPADFNTPGNQHQWSWAEGNELKLFGCESPVGWQFFLFNLTSDRAETTDLWRAQRSTALSMFGRFQKWQQSVLRSQGPEEIGCNPPTPFP